MILHPSFASFNGQQQQQPPPWSRGLTELTAAMDPRSSLFHPLYEAIVPPPLPPPSSSSSAGGFRFQPQKEEDAETAAAEEEDDEDDDDDEVGVGGGGRGRGGEEQQEEVWLDPVIWSRLPEKMIERVLAVLPFPFFFRMRLVCKKFYHLLFSDSFLELCSAMAPLAGSPRHCFLLFKPGQWGQAFVFNPELKKWHRLDLSFLPPGFTIVASAGGLLCCLSEAAGLKKVLICNPLTRAYVQLPSTLKERFVPTVGLLFDKPTNAYKVMAAGDDLISPFAVKNLTTEVYDSSARFWRISSPLPRLCSLESGKATFVGGFFYSMNYSPFSVLSYDTQQGSWNKIQAPMRRFLRNPNLVECRGRLVLVAAVEKNKLNVPKSIRIWGLQQQGKNGWVELERMPNALYEEFMMVSKERAFSCTGHGNLILITLKEGPQMLVYNFYEKVWAWSPRCPFLDHDDPATIHQGLQGFPFEPRLEASVY